MATNTGDQTRDLEVSLAKPPTGAANQLAGVGEAEIPLQEGPGVGEAEIPLQHRTIRPRTFDVLDDDVLEALGLSEDDVALVEESAAFPPMASHEVDPAPESPDPTAEATLESIAPSTSESSSSSSD